MTELEKAIDEAKTFIPVTNVEKLIVEKFKHALDLAMKEIEEKDKQNKKDYDEYIFYMEQADNSNDYLKDRILELESAMRKAIDDIEYAMNCDDSSAVKTAKHRLQQALDGGKK